MQFVGEKGQQWFDSRDEDSDGLLEESEMPSRVWNKWTEAGVDANDDGGISFAELFDFQATSTNTDTEDTVNQPKTHGGLTVTVEMGQRNALRNFSIAISSFAQSVGWRFGR